MKARHLLAVSLFLAGAAAVAIAASTSATAVVCTGVENRAPVGAAESFPPSVGQLTCFSEVRSGSGTVVHVWFHRDREVRRVELPVKGERWRTWSVKSIPASWTGPWRVEVRDPDGAVLATASFRID